MKFIARIHAEPDPETGPGEPDADDKGMMKKAPMKRPSQFSLPKSGKKMPPKKGPKNG